MNVKKLLSAVLMLLCLTCAALAEEACPVCGDVSAGCLTDEYGAVYCSGTLVSYPADQTAASYTVREGTRMIGGGAFRGCVSLQAVKLPDSLLIIGEDAFRDCAMLERVNDHALPSGLYAVGNAAFAGCMKLHALDVPSSLRMIGDEAFAGSGLEELYLHTTQFLYGKDVLPEHQVTIHMPGEFPMGVITDFVAEHPNTALRFDLAEEEW